MKTIDNIYIYWDFSRGVVGVHFGDGQFQAEEPIDGRETLSDSEILSLVDSAISRRNQG